MSMPAIRRLSRIAAALAGALVLFVSVHTAQASPATERFAQDVIDRGYVILNNTALPEAERRQQFKTFMLGLTDLRRIAVFTLGQYANGASKAEIDDFVDAFSNYAVAIYEWRLSKYRGQTLKVTGSRDTPPDDSVVNTVVVNPTAPNAPPIRAAFRVRNGAAGKPVITDMQVEGIWLAINQRSDFTSFLQQNGGKVPALSESLKAQTRLLWGG
jgi:phospholipid transport system substrate-binding protein